MDTPSTSSHHGRRRRMVVTGLWLVALGLVLFGTRLYGIGAYGNATPFWDQWNGEGLKLYKPWLEGQLEWRALVAPHIVHRIFTSRLLALGLLSANGTWNPLLQMVVNAALWVGILGVLVVLLDRATGRRHLHLLLAFALVAFGLPYGGRNMLSGFQGCFYFVVFWSLLALRLLALSRPFAAGWWAGLGCGLLSFLSLGSGIFTLAAAAAVAAAQYATGARRGRLQLASAGVLAALFVAGAMLTPKHQAQDRLVATSMGHALVAWTEAASWPLEIGLVGPLVALVPAIALAAIMLRRPPAAGDPRWFLLAAVAGGLGHTVAIAYGRAADSLSPRYLDLYAVAVFVNFACALAAFSDLAARGRARAVAAVVAWVGVMLGALALQTHREARQELAWRRDTAAAQEAHTRAYVLTHDMRHLEGKPRFHVPFPDAERLATFLDDPSIRSVLPAVVAPPLTASAFTSEPADAFVAGGVGPTLPSRDEPAWGSHGTSGADATGVAAITFQDSRRGYAVSVPIAVGGDVTGIGIEVEQDGRRSPIAVPATRGAWTPVRIKVQGRPFTLHVADRTATGWVAVGAPTVEGRFDRQVARLLGRWDAFVLAGLVLAVALVVCEGLAAARD